MREVFIETVSRPLAIAITNNNDILPIIVWFDGDGEECDFIDGLVCVAKYGEKFVTIDLREFESVSLN